MKRLHPIAFAVVCMALFIVSCEEDKILPSEVSSTVTATQWKVSYLWEGGSEKTENFTGFSFTFIATPGTNPASGIVEASDGSTDVVGSWSTGYIGDSSKLELSFSLTPFNTLREDWEVVELSSTTIKLKQGDSKNLTLEAL